MAGHIPAKYHRDLESHIRGSSKLLMNLVDGLILGEIKQVENDMGHFATNAEALLISCWN
jgi:hypothetical protein